MAEYGIQATELSAPQGAGATPVAPVQEIRNPLVPIVGSVIDIFAKGLKEDKKEQAEKLKQSIIAGYVQNETAINDAVATGQMSAEQAAARSRANFNKHAAGYSQYISDFEAAGKALRGFTEKGEVEDKLKSDKDIRKNDIQQAQQRGFTFVPGMSLAAENSQIRAAKAGIQAEQELNEQIKRNVERRADAGFNQQIIDRERKETSIRLINNIADTNLDAFRDFTSTLGDQVRSGKLPPEEAQVLLNDRFSKINSMIQAAASTNPELAGPYRSLFNEVNEVGRKLIDPKASAEDAASALKLIETKMKLLVMTGDPKVAGAVIANQMLPYVPDAALAASGSAVKIINQISNMPIDSKGYVPQILGNPDVEPEALKLLREGLKAFNNGKVGDKNIAATQAGNSINQILKQSGDLLNRGVQPKEIKGLAEFVASPEYAQFISSGKIDKQAAGTASTLFQQLYTPTIVQGVQQKLDTYLQGQASFGQKQGEPVRLSEVVSVKFSGSGVIFEQKERKGLDPVELRSQVASVRELQMTQAAINQLVHIGTHMEGSTDYSGYWNKMKYELVPQLYPVRPGTVVNGYRFKSVDGEGYDNPRNWEPAKK